jgi:hypothetical protein
MGLAGFEGFVGFVDGVMAVALRRSRGLECEDSAGRDACSLGLFISLDSSAKHAACMHCSTQNRVREHGQTADEIRFT